MKELLEVAKAALEYIDALPLDVVDSLPGMPGFDRDWANRVIDHASQSSDASDPKSRCTYCDAWGDEHLTGCPDGPD